MSRGLRVIGGILCFEATKYIWDDDNLIKWPAKGGSLETVTRLFPTVVHLPTIQYPSGCTQTRTHRPGLDDHNDPVVATVTTTQTTAPGTNDHEATTTLAVTTTSPTKLATTMMTISATAAATRPIAAQPDTAHPKDSFLERCHSRLQRLGDDNNPRGRKDVGSNDHNKARTTAAVIITTTMMATRWWRWR